MSLWCSTNMQILSRPHTECFYFLSLSLFSVCLGIRYPSRNLSYNNLTRLDEGSLSVLGDLHTLRLGHNSISHITEGAFRGLKALRIL